MPHSEDEESDISESEIEDVTNCVFNKLKEHKYEFKCCDGSFRCPFCVKKKRKNLNRIDLLQHSKRIASSSSNFRQLAFHQGLARFLTNDPASELPLQKLVQVSPHDPLKVDEKVLVGKGIYVWPWMGIIVNIPTVLINRLQVGENGSKLKQKYFKFNPEKVHALWNVRGHSGNAVVDFRRDWSGFQDALNFSRHFEAEHHGRKEWRDRRYRSTSFFGWIADEDDFKALGIIGDHLRKNGDLKTVSEVEQEQSRKQSLLLATLTNQITQQEENFEHLEQEFRKNSKYLESIVKVKDRLAQIHNEEIEKLQREELNHLKRASEHNEKLRMELELRNRELELRSQELEIMEAENENERKKIEEERKKNVADSHTLHMARLIKEKVDKNVFRLREEHKKARKEAQEEMIGREKELNAKHQLELEIEQLKGQLEVEMHMKGVDGSSGKKFAEMKAELKEKKESMEGLEDLNRTLIIKDRKSKEELLAARQKLIAGLKMMSTAKSCIIGVKRVGEIDKKPFEAACNSRLSPEVASIRAAELCSLWQDVYFKDPEWHPFKQSIAEENTYDVIDEDDNKLKKLKAEWGLDVFKAVTNAFMELIKYNPGGRDCVDEIWNLRENRSASLREGIEYVLKRAFHS